MPPAGGQLSVPAQPRQSLSGFMDEAARGRSTQGREAPPIRRASSCRGWQACGALLAPQRIPLSYPRTRRSPPRLPLMITMLYPFLIITEKARAKNRIGGKFSRYRVAMALPQQISAWRSEGAAKRLDAPLPALTHVLKRSSRLRAAAGGHRVPMCAALAQSVEHRIRNARVASSSLAGGTVQSSR